MDEIRLIDAEELKSDLKQYFSDGVLDGISAKLAFNMILRKIDEAPTVEPKFKPIAEVKFDEKQLQEIVDKAKAEVLASIERPQGEWGKWNVYEIRCPECLEYFNTDCYSKEELNKCPNCGADLRPEKKLQTPSCLTNPERQAELLERYKEE